MPGHLASVPPLVELHRGQGRAPDGVADPVDGPRALTRHGRLPSRHCGRTAGMGEARDSGRRFERTQSRHVPQPAASQEGSLPRRRGACGSCHSFRTMCARFAVTPCPYHLNCVRGCADYLRTKGSEGERRHLIQIRDATEYSLSSARTHGAKGNMQIAEPWIQHCEETLVGVKRALAVDEEINESGPAVRAFPDGRSRFKARKD